MKGLKILVAMAVMLSSLNVFAADVATDAAAVTDSWVTTDDVKVDVPTGTLNADDLPADSENVSVDNTWSDATLNSASGKDVIATAQVAIWNYKEVPCDQTYFTENSCTQCFDGGKKAVWEKLTWFTDSWTNPNTTEQIIYKDEQTMPALINLWWVGTVWNTNPQEADKFWKFADEIAWTDSATGSGTQEFLLEWSKTVNFLESDLWASYSMQSTDKNEWEPVWLVKFTLNYHDTDENAKEWDIKTHTECVAYMAWTPVAVQAAPETPKEVTKVKTGPESVLLIFAALILWFGLTKLRKRA